MQPFAFEINCVAQGQPRVRRELCCPDAALDFVVGVRVNPAVDFVRRRAAGVFEIHGFSAFLKRLGWAP